VPAESTFIQRLRAEIDVDFSALQDYARALQRLRKEYTDVGRKVGSLIGGHMQLKSVLKKQKVDWDYVLQRQMKYRNELKKLQPVLEHEVAILSKLHPKLGQIAHDLDVLVASKIGFTRATRQAVRAVNDYSDAMKGQRLHTVGWRRNIGRIRNSLLLLSFAFGGVVSVNLLKRH